MELFFVDNNVNICCIATLRNRKQLTDSGPALKMMQCNFGPDFGSCVCACVGVYQTLPVNLASFGSILTEKR